MSDTFEPDVLRHLMDAMEALGRAARDTKDGLVEDHCKNAMHEVLKAGRIAFGIEPVKRQPWPYSDADGGE